ncbi:MAG: hypothetical protein IPL22_20240 [Bacteroidetes bacterium]|nr:hypothetical protein [Bacteroidota bacterium]
MPDWNSLGKNNINDQTRFIGTLNAADLVFKTSNGWSGPNEAIRINQAGGIGIGISNIPPGYKMVVDGKVGFREAYVKLSGAWPDYVFDGNYKLQPLHELQKYISLNQHLPGIPTAAEIDAEGQNLGEIQRLQQEKIEEVFLHIIKLNERIEYLEEENRLLKMKK